MGLFSEIYQTTITTTTLQDKHSARRGLLLNAVLISPGGLPRASHHRLRSSPHRILDSSEINLSLVSYSLAELFHLDVKLIALGKICDSKPPLPVCRSCSHENVAKKKRIQLIY